MSRRPLRGPGPGFAALTFPALLSGVLVLAALAGCASRAVPDLLADPGPDSAGPDAGGPDAAGLGEGRIGTYRVFLPPGYPDAAPYPVLYFLHDFFGASGVLWEQGVMRSVEEAMAAGEAAPMIVVAPDGGKGYWSDFHDGSRLYETWVAEGLRRRVEASYPVRTDRAGRAVAGISMGGFGAVKVALRRPGLYSRATSLSGALLPLDREAVRSSPFFLRLALRRVFGASRDDNNLAENDLRLLLRAAGTNPAACPPLVLWSGTEDKYHLDEAARRFADQARSAGLEVELVLEPGGHDWGYWRTSAVRALLAQAAAFSGADDERSSVR